MMAMPRHARPPCRGTRPTGTDPPPPSPPPATARSVALGVGYCRNASGSNAWDHTASCLDTVQECGQAAEATADCACFAYASPDTLPNADGGCKAAGAGRCVLYVGDAAVGARELEAAVGGDHRDERHLRGRVRRDRLAVGRQHRLAVAVVGEDEQPDARLRAGVAHLADAVVGVRRRLHRLVEHPGVPHHVGRRQVADEQRVRARLDLAHHRVGHRLRRHLRLQVVRGHLGRLLHLVDLPVEGLLAPAVEEERHVGVLFRLRGAQLALARYATRAGGAPAILGV